MGFRSIMGKLNDAYKKRQAGAEARAEAKLEKLKKKTARDKVIANLKREQAIAQRDLSQARAAAKKAETARKKASREAWDLGLGNIFSFGKPAKRRVVRHRRPKAKAAKKRITKRRKSSKTGRTITINI